MLGMKQELQKVYGDMMHECGVAKLYGYVGNYVRFLLSLSTR